MFYVDIYNDKMTKNVTKTALKLVHDREDTYIMVKKRKWPKGKKKRLRRLKITKING